MGTLENFFDYVESYPINTFVVNGSNYTITDNRQVEATFVNSYVLLAIPGPVIPHKITFKVQYLTTHIIKDSAGVELHRDVHTRSTSTLVISRGMAQWPEVRQSISDRREYKADGTNTHERYWIKITIMSYTSQNETTGKITTYSETNPSGAQASKGCALTIGLMVIPMVLYLAGLLI